MKIKNMRRAGFTLVEIMIVVAIIGLLAAIAIPNFVKARNTAQSNACINNMRQIESAIQQWALETRKKDTDGIVSASIALYIKGEKMPECPGGGEYRLANEVRANPGVTCTLADQPSLGAHKLGQ